ncbi:hypothetical protein D9757_002753 [Collybiopsis confluens]|uniref:Yeast cell wall synthesis Kre9/Knh1-like N-terminal domain-containing protein n=1 Tax=Collybiopsis confluens TaxID=2823264 RepID=A0A8H5MDL6_9AGAR|nr:hypothetical protein D9757_002753 [Collybiopsis confluens]
MQQSTFLAILSGVFAVLASGSAITPTAPGPGDKPFKAGSPCIIKWLPGDWSNFSITLMSGSNLQMNPVKLVANGLNGSDASLSPYSWTCPQVDPYSAIYFYQFTNGDDIANSKWTTRFTISSPSGDSTPPPNAAQSNGDVIPWGIGSLRSDTSTSTSTTTDAFIATSTPFSTSSTSSGMRKSKSATNTERQPTPTLNSPSGPTVTHATFVTKPAQTGGAIAIRASGRWAIAPVLPLVLMRQYFLL